MTSGKIQRIIVDDELINFNSLEEFLSFIGRPTWFFFPGKLNHSCRVITTLLHGNEPSGCHAVFKLIKENFTPEVDSWVLIASVDTALKEPVFTHRYKDGVQDLNRCFRAPWITETEQLAKQIKRDIEDFQPEAVIDVHNTSGAGPGFCVSTSKSVMMDQLACIFTNSLVITNIKLGALMEVEFNCPVLTVECGGNKSELSHLFAYNGIRKYLSIADLASIQITDDLQHYLHPLRLELKKGHKLAYGDSLKEDSDITLCHSIEYQNFGTTVPEKRLGWLGNKGLESLLVLNSENLNLVGEYFNNRDGELYTKKHLHLFMVTTNKTIAEADCLFYLSSAATF